ncbi:HNH endonuclease [Shouchella miscanthi]|uniref:HNH endonuclease n=1 Tax=Shouchella miscanthi TaxID=2598861 RepID=UPI0011A4675E|nr:HNH endonuclease signature motif containing protein [Shouchella miscanthi]
MSKVDFIEKPFEELTVEEFRSMRRNPKGSISLTDFLGHYNISIQEYWDYVTENKGVAIVHEERQTLTNYKAAQNQRQPDELEYTGAEIQGFRMLRGYNTNKMSHRIGIFADELKRYERRKKVPNWIADRYISDLMITKNEIHRLRMYLGRRTKGFEAERTIPEFIKNEVRKRDRNKCTKCFSENRLHFHHKERFSKGGLHVESNIVLLCAACHAEEHKSEQSYWLLKKMAKDARINE